MSQAQLMNDVMRRLLDPVSECLSLGAARKLIRLRADPVAQRRIELLADKATEGRLTAEEAAEYEAYRSVGEVISILQSKARALVTRVEHA